MAQAVVQLPVDSQATGVGNTKVQSCFQSFNVLRRRVCCRPSLRKRRIACYEFMGNDNDKHHKSVTIGIGILVYVRSSRTQIDRASYYFKSVSKRVLNVCTLLLVMHARHFHAYIY
jgi:hypothetical protein